MFAKNKKNAGIIVLLLACMVLSACQNSDDSNKTGTLNTVNSQNTNNSFIASKTETVIDDTLPDVTTVESQSSTSDKTSTSKNTSTTSSSKTNKTTSSSKTSTKKPSTTSSETNSKTTTSSSPKKTSTSKTDSPEVELNPDIIDSVNAQLIISQIPQKDRAVLEKINKEINNFKETITFAYGEATQQQVENALMIISLTNLTDNYVSPEYTLSVDHRGNVTKLVLTFTKTAKQYADELEKLETVIDEMIAGCTADNDYDAVKYFHDEIIRRCKYDANAENMLSAYGCLVDGRAVCEGYAKALILLCSEYGIECVPITGNTRNSEGVVEPHMWNLVKLDDVWYHFDLTWNDPITTLGEDFIKYDYFAVSDEVISIDHEITPIVYFTYPVADNSENDYFTRYGLKFDDVQAAVTEFEKIVCEAVKNEQRYVRIKLSDAEKFAQFKTRVFETATENGIKEIFNILARAKENSGSEVFNPTRFGKVFNENMNIILIVLNYE